MDVNKITTTEPKKKHNLAIATAAGAAAGMAARYVVPTKNEFSSIFNKQAFDTFVSSTAKRGASRSMLKYGGIGALVAIGIHYLSKAFKYDAMQSAKDFEYTKLGAIIDAPAHSCEILWYQD